MKIISGGQTGVDRAALQVARELGFETGGWMPQGFLALDGRHPEYAETYGMHETVGHVDYATRTMLNVRDSNATLRIARRWDSAGEQCTIKWCHKLNKPAIGISFPLHQSALSVNDVVQRLRELKPRVLNVAGNSERTWRGATHEARLILIDILTRLDDD